jgi:hypothetical protein
MDEDENEPRVIILNEEQLEQAAYAHVLAASGVIVLGKLGFTVTSKADISIDAGSLIPDKVVITLTWDLSKDGND